MTDIIKRLTAGNNMAISFDVLLLNGGIGDSVTENKNKMLSYVYVAYKYCFIVD